MAFQDSSGGKHTNHSSYKSAEARLQSKGPSAAPQTEPEDPNAAPEQDGAALAQQHGPAVQLDIQHQEPQHTVHAVHPDGHSHESQHASAADAHKFAADCAGVGTMAQ